MANNYPGFGIPAVQGVLFETTPMARQFQEIPAPTQSGILVGAATGLVVACSGTQQPPSTPSTPAQYWS